jgi:hypothetical protein
MPRPKLTDEERAARAKAKKEKPDVEIRDSIRIYFSPLQFARLRDYHKQGGPLQGEQIRLAVDAYHKSLIESREYVPGEQATPDGARAAWAERQAKQHAKKREGKDGGEVGEDK